MSGTVLVVEDDRATAGLIRVALESEGYRVLQAVGGEGLGVAITEHPDVILLDIHMPGMNGVEVSQRLRANPETAAIPIIGMSASIGRGVLPTGMLADDQLAKPFAIDDLCILVNRWITLS